MTSVRTTLAASLFALSAVALPPAAAAADVEQPPGIDPEAMRLLQRMTEFTAELDAFSVNTQNTLEDLLDSGQRVDFDVAARVLVRRPNRLHAERIGELIDQEFYYDGKAVTFFRPTDGVYASEPAPETLEELLDYARENLGLVIPVSDLVYRNSFAILSDKLTSAVVVGKAMIEGTSCHHLAFSRPDVDYQVWIAEGERPLPCKYVVTDTSTPQLVSTVTVMSGWNLSPDAGDDQFRFTPPAEATELEFLPNDAGSAYGR